MPNRRLTLLLGMLLSISASLGNADGASFDCAKAKTSVEQLICEDQELSILDKQASGMYRSATRTNPAADLQRHQRFWLKKRDQCDDRDCVKSLYFDRISAFEALLAPHEPVKPAFSTSVDGLVDKLLISPSRDILLATVRSDGEIKVGKRYGLIVFSLEDPLRPTQIAYVPVISPTDFAISSDGRYAYILNSPFQNYPSDQPYGVIVVDLMKHDDPKIVRVIRGEFIHMHLSQDGKYLFLQERNFQHEPDAPGIFIVRTTDIDSKECRFHYPRQSNIGEIFAYGFATFPNSSQLLVEDSANALYLFDISDYCQPKFERKFDPQEIGGSIFGGYQNTLYVGGNGLMIFKLSDELTLVNEYFWGGILERYHVDEQTNTIVGAFGKDAKVFRSGANEGLEVCEQYRMPNYLGDVISWDSKTLYAGLLGSLAVVTRTANTTCAQSLQ